MANWQDIPEGYYAVPDPGRADRMQYWCRKDVATKRGIRPTFKPWPPGVAGVKLTGGMRPVSGHMVQVIEAITSDPITLGRRFADLTLRCCLCSKPLTDPKSKTYGIGPECRKGIRAEVLARYFTPAVAEAHAAAAVEQEQLTL